MGFKRKFDPNPQQHDSGDIGGEHHEEIPTLSARIEEKQKRVDTRLVPV